MCNTRGHSNNTWHFFGTCDIFQFFADWFLGINCFEILNGLGRKYLLKLYLAFWQKVFLPKELNAVFQKAQKYVTLRRVTYYLNEPKEETLFTTAVGKEADAILEDRVVEKNCSKIFYFNRSLLMGPWNVISLNIDNTKQFSHC